MDHPLLRACNIAHASLCMLEDGLWSKEKGWKALQAVKDNLTGSEGGRAG